MSARRYVQREWPNGVGHSTRLGNFDVCRYHDTARGQGFGLPPEVVVTFTHDRRWSGWPILSTYTVRA